MSDQVLDTLRLTQLDVVLFLSEMERSGDSDSHAQRRFRRWRMQYQRSVLTLLDAVGNPSHFTVVPRNLSVEGVGLLLGTFVHAGTKCVMVLRCANGSVRMHPGVVVRCRLHKRHVHDVGVRFDSRVNPEDYLVAPTKDLRFNVERVDVATLGGSILLVDGDAARRETFAQAFNGSGVVVKGVPDGAAGRALMGEAPHMIFVHEALADGDGCGFARAVRAEGHATPVIMLAESVTPELRQRAREAGVHEVLALGCEATMLHRAAAEFLPLRVLKLEAPKAAEKPKEDGVEDAGCEGKKAA